MLYQGFIGGSYPSQSFTADISRTVNFYLERMEINEGPTTRAILCPTPGVSILSTTTDAPGKAHLTEAGREFAVIGPTFYEILSSGATVNRGTVQADTFPATITGNGAGQVFITSGGNGYNFTLSTNVLAQISNLNQKARMGAFIDGYFVALDTISNPVTSTLYISALLDGSTWDLTKFIQRSAASDPWVAVYVANRYLFMLGERTSEVWYDAGTFPVPFSLYPSGLLSYGCLAPFSGKFIDGNLFWLGRTKDGFGQVVRVAGFSPEPISIDPFENQVTRYTNPSDAIGDSYTDLGHSFYLLSFSSDQHTWSYDLGSQAWSERGTWIAEEGRYRAWRPRFHSFAFNQHRWLDSEIGSVYQSSDTFLMDVDGRPLRRERIGPIVEFENERLFHSKFELDLDRGQGATTGQGSIPEVMLQYSNDSGQTWSSEAWRSAGMTGQYQAKVAWYRLGVSRRRAYRIAMTDPVPWRLTAAYLDTTSSMIANRKAQRRQPAQAEQR